MIEVLVAPPFASIQDLGRQGHRHQGVPPAGAMDAEALALGNLLVGNRIEAAGIEWGLGPGRVVLRGGGWIAVTGAEADVRLGESPVPGWTCCRVSPGAEIELGVPRSGRFCYLVIQGGVAVEPVLGSRSTYLRGGFGGLEGRLLRRQAQLPVGSPETAPLAPDRVPLPPELRRSPETDIRALGGPQEAVFDTRAWELLGSNAFSVSRAADRMGYRLDGPSLPHSADATVPSEPACPGAIQVPKDGLPIVLMPDGPTVGGYPKLGVVLSTDLGRMAQHAPGEQVRCRRVSLDEARAAITEWRERIGQVRDWISSSAAR